MLVLQIGQNKACTEAGLAAFLKWKVHWFRLGERSLYVAIRERFPNFRK